MRITDLDRLRRLVSCPHGDLVSTPVLDVIAKSGALLEGHFELQSRRHSNHFLRFSQIGWNPTHVDLVVALLRQVAAPLLARRATIVCPESAGYLLGKALSRATGWELAVTQINDKRQPVAQLRFGSIDPTVPALIVNDVVTTGASLLPMIALAREAAQQPTPIAGVLVFAVLSTDRLMQLLAEQGIAGEWLVASTWETREADTCNCSSAMPASELN